MFEHRRDRLLPRPLFIRRVLKYRAGLLRFSGSLLAHRHLRLSAAGGHVLAGCLCQCRHDPGRHGAGGRTAHPGRQVLRRLLCPLLRADRGDFHGHPHCPGLPPLFAPLSSGSIGGTAIEPVLKKAVGLPNRKLAKEEFMPFVNIKITKEGATRRAEGAADSGSNRSARRYPGQEPPNHRRAHRGSGHR